MSQKFPIVPDECPLETGRATVIRFEGRMACLLGAAVTLLLLSALPFYGPTWRYLITLQPQNFRWWLGAYASPAPALPVLAGLVFCAWWLWVRCLAGRVTPRRGAWVAATVLALLFQILFIGLWRVDRFRWYLVEMAKPRLESFTLPRSVVFWRAADLRERWPHDKRVVVLVGSSQMNFAVDIPAVRESLPDTIVVARTLPGFGINQYLQVVDRLADKGATDLVCWISEFDAFREKRLPVNRLRYTAGARSTCTFAELLGPARSFANRSELADLATAAVLPQWCERDTISRVAFDFWWLKTQSTQAMPVSEDNGKSDFDRERQRENVRASITRTGMVEFNFGSFESFARRAKVRGLRLHVFEGQTNIMPLSPELASYRCEVRAHLRAMAQKMDFEYVDESQMPAFSETDFCDVYHLGEKGRAKFTAFLVGRLGAHGAPREASSSLLEQAPVRLFAVGNARRE
jgi:hypothetical protein